MSEGFTGKRTLIQHWPIVVLGFLVAGIFLAALITFDVKQTDCAIVLRFGSPRRSGGADGPVKVYDAGLHLKWPYPIETVWRQDNRLQCYELQKGQVEQIQTADDYQVVVTTYVLWRIDHENPGLFLKSVGTTAEAEKKLDDVVRNSRNIVLGRHRLTELINVDASQVKLEQIESEILNGVDESNDPGTPADDVRIVGVRDIAKRKYGIDVRHLGFKHLGFPETVSTKVFARMKAERSRKSAELRAQGDRDAKTIRADADLKKEELLAEAAGKAEGIRAEGDQIAAGHYAAFSKNPELAAFLRKLSSLRRTLSEKTTIIVDTQTPPYDLLLPGATDLDSAVSGSAGKGKVEREPNQ